MTEPTRSAGVTDLVDALLEGYAPISVILDHMFQSPGHPTVEEVHGSIGELLRDVLEPLAADYDADDLATAARVIEATVPLIHENLFVVPHPNREARRRQGGRRNARRP